MAGVIDRKYARGGSVGGPAAGAGSKRRRRQTFTGPFDLGAGGGSRPAPSTGGTGNQQSGGQYLNVPRFGKGGKVKTKKMSDKRFGRH